MKAVALRYPVVLWFGIALILAASLGHLWLEFDRAMRVAPQLKLGPELVAHTFEVIATAQSLQRTVQDAERGQRGYVATGDAAYLERYRKSDKEVPALLAKLKQLTADNPEQQRRWPVLEQQIGLKLADLRQTLDLGERRGLEAARQIVRTNAGFDSMQGINATFDAAIAAERALVRERLARAAEFEHQGQRAALLGAVLSTVALLLGVALILSALRRLGQTEAAQQEADHRFRLLVEGVTDYAIYMIDPRGNVMEWNAGAERIKGYMAEEIIGQNFSRFYTEADRKAGAPERALQRALKEGKYEQEGAVRVRKDGTRFLASISIEPLRDASGRLVGFAKITRDIDQRVRERAELTQYQKMDALGQLTGGIAHDFNNLLHVIRNAADLLERRLPDAGPDVRKYLDMLKRNADRAASLTQRLLAFSRRQVLDPKPIYPNALIIDVSTLLKQALGENIAIETVTGAGVWWISADASQLETAILNLALNARDAMSGRGKVTIEISNALLDETYAAAHAEVMPGQYVMIAVSDTGPGMPPEVAAKAFEPFFTTKEMGQGTGLGLSQVYGFVKQSGGHAKIYSEPGAGTTVKLYLPRHVGTPMLEPPPRSPAHPGGTERGKILVVEDERDVREFTATVLGELGYEVLTAGDAESALGVLLGEAGGVDLLFTDIGLPGGMNGRQLADEALKRFPRLRVLFTTGYTRNAVIHHGRLDPGVQLIVKPFTQSSLAGKVKHVLKAQA
jgi:PAS domain S-box-containing protein